MKIRWTEKASKDALGIYDHIAANSELYAESVYLQLLARPDQLARFPESGSVVPEYNRSEVRELLVQSYRLIYRIVESEIRIVTIIHGSRRLPDTLPNDG